MVAITPTDAGYRRCFDTDATVTYRDQYEIALAVYGPDALDTWEASEALDSLPAVDPDRGRDICDAFARDVAELAYLDLRMHGHTISVRHAGLEYERFAIDTADRLTERIDDDFPW